MQMTSMLARRQVQTADRMRKNGNWTLQRVCFGSPASSACGGPRGPRHAHLRLCVWSAAAGFAAANGVYRARWEGGGATQPVFVQARAAPPRFACESSARAQSHSATKP
jgi:hypothetical protein